MAKVIIFRNRNVTVQSSGCNDRNLSAICIALGIVDVKHNSARRRLGRKQRCSGAGREKVRLFYFPNSMINGPRVVMTSQFHFITKETKAIFFTTQYNGRRHMLSVKTKCICVFLYTFFLKRWITYFRSHSDIFDQIV